MKIKNIVTIFWMLIIPTLSSNAQNFKVGLLAGFDVANSNIIKKPYNGADTRSYSPIISFNINGYAGYKSKSYWGLSLEPGFIQKGGVQKGTGDNIRIQLNYIQIPVLADIYLLDKLFLSVGPEFAYLLNKKAKSGAISNNLDDYYYKAFELSGLIGINYSLSKNFEIALRYNHGLTYTSKITFTDSRGTQEGESKEYNQYFQFIVRFKIKTGANTRYS